MGARPTPARGDQSGNFVAEWFGHRVWPVVDINDAARVNQAARACPFLTTATGEATECVKRLRGYDEPTGLCSVSSDSNGTRQDWTACPNRTLDQHFTLLSSAVRDAYGVTDPTLTMLPVTVLHRPEQRQRLQDALNKSERAFLFSSTKLGGEIELPETEGSPGAAVDMSVIEVTAVDGTGRPTTFGKHLFYEIQTSDFHGSPLHAVKLLAAACPKTTSPTATYHDRLKQHVEIAGTGVEGPNKANIFKRTVYQMIFKIELAKHQDCAGFAIVLPVPVWESWLKHLGQPRFAPISNDPTHVALLAPGEAVNATVSEAEATIYVFEADHQSQESPQPLHIVRRVVCSADSLKHHAFDVASREAINRGVIDMFRAGFIERVRRGAAGLLAADRAPKAPRARRRPANEQPAVPTAGPTTTTASGEVASDVEED